MKLVFIHRGPLIKMSSSISSVLHTLDNLKQGGSLTWVTMPSDHPSQLAFSRVASVKMQTRPWSTVGSLLIGSRV